MHGLNKNAYKAFIGTPPPRIQEEDEITIL
jgi:hypothetical protein